MGLLERGRRFSKFLGIEWGFLNFVVMGADNFGVSGEMYFVYRCSLKIVFANFKGLFFCIVGVCFFVEGA